MQKILSLIFPKTCKIAFLYDQEMAKCIPFIYTKKDKSKNYIIVIFWQ